MADALVSPTTVLRELLLKDAVRLSSIWTTVDEFCAMRYLSDSGMINAAQAAGLRLYQESGAGRTRAEANRPAETSAAAGI